jgi:hypothetical protein
MSCLFFGQHRMQMDTSAPGSDNLLPNFKSFFTCRLFAEFIDYFKTSAAPQRRASEALQCWI